MVPSLAHAALSARLISRWSLQEHRSISSFFRSHRRFRDDNPLTGRTRIGYTVVRNGNLRPYAFQIASCSACALRKYEIKSWRSGGTLTRLRVYLDPWAIARGDSFRNHFLRSF